MQLVADRDWEIIERAGLTTGGGPPNSGGQAHHLASGPASCAGGNVRIRTAITMDDVMLTAAGTENVAARKDVEAVLQLRLSDPLQQENPIGVLAAHVDSGRGQRPAPPQGALARAVLAGRAEKQQGGFFFEKASPWVLDARPISSVEQLAGDLLDRSIPTPGRQPVAGFGQAFCEFCCKA